MSPGTVVNLTKSVTTIGGGVIATYKLNKNATIPVLVLGKVPTPEQLVKIKAILAT